jgi:mono/diheme cytochrome c family protein
LIVSLLIAGSTWAQAVPSSFAQGAYAVLEKAQCRSCHNTDGVAAGTRLLFPEGEDLPRGSKPLAVRSSVLSTA